MKLDLNEIRKVANISKLDLSEEEIVSMEKDMKEILEAFNFIDSIDVSNIEESFHAVEIWDVFREDEVEKSLLVEESLKNALNKENNFFKTPKIMEK